MTRETMKMYLESTFSNRVDIVVRKAKCDVTIKVSSDLIPKVMLDTHDQYIFVDFETVELVGEDGSIGYEFVPTINNAGLNQNMSEIDGEDVEDTFRRWANIAEAAYEIYCTEFWPYEYEYEDEL